MKRRVVITGMGAVTPIGNTLDEFWNGIKEEKVGIGAITKFDTEDYKVKIAAEVKDFNVKERLDNKAARRMEVFSQYAVAASREAFAMAGLDMEKEDPYRVGVIIGSGIGGLSSMEKEHEKIITKGPKRVSPMLIPLMISNMAAGNVAIDLGCKGKCTDVVTACATGSNSIGDALRAIQYGDADVMLAGGTESSITPVAVAGFTNLTALSSESDPLRASLPFDEARGGFVIGEGAGVVVLEELEHAKKRGAKILAELAGYGSTCDAFHITSPAEDGSGAAKAMELAMEEGADRIYILGGTGTRLDHVVANIKLLSHALERKKECILMDAHNRIRLIDQPLTIEKKKQYGKYVSLFAFGGQVKGLTLRGFFYPLTEYDMEAENPLGVSNEITAENGEISFLSGKLLVMESKD